MNSALNATGDAALSLEMAWYELDQGWLPNDLRAVICKAIVRLPPEVQDFALNNCTYISYDTKIHGQALPASTFTHLTRRGRTMRNHFAILLNVSIVNSKSDREYTVAHEIAHAWLGHPIMSDDLTGEEQADAMVESWGFRIPKYRRRLHAQLRHHIEKAAAEMTEGDKVWQARAKAIAQKGARAK
jgi:hypothetical protein